ncbi:restriction endonuclease subunit S [Psychrobacter sp. DM8]|uniref:restriction endonuclease subunit S n=1 Tax=Psychrobacter sp. DM8 TaxID=3440636 RepID=UPI003F4FCFFC
MASDWEKTTLDEVCIKITDGAHKSPKSVDSGKPMASVKDLEFYGLNLETARHISEEDYDDLVKQGCKPELGDVLIAKDGNSALDTVCTFEKDAEVVLLSSVAILRPNPEKINSRFLKYYFLSSRTIEYLKRNFISGAAIPRVVLRDFKKAEISLPFIPEQKTIAHVLGTLDDKIELNRQMNETLEAMAQALFKSWFVDFDPVIDNALAAGNAIPDEFIERSDQRKGIKKKGNSDINHLFPNEFEFTEEMGWIPKGWSVRSIKDIGRVVTGKTPSKKIDNAYNEDGTPFITPTDIDDLPFIINTNRYLSENGVNAVKNSRISAGSICVTCIGSQMGKTTISPSASVTNQQINSITNCNEFWRNYLFFNLRRRREEIFHLGSSGSTMPILNKSNFEALPILCPNEKLLISLDSHFQSTIDIILENTKQNQTLAKLRDTLLPKLMSGELRISDTL